MPEGKTSISKASSYQEIGEFWDTHDFTDYLDDSAVVDFEVGDIRTGEIYCPIETDLATEIRSVAKRKGVSASALLNSWIREKLRQESV